MASPTRATRPWTTEAGGESSSRLEEIVADEAPTPRPVSEQLAPAPAAAEAAVIATPEVRPRRLASAKTPPGHRRSLVSPEGATEPLPQLRQVDDERDSGEASDENAQAGASTELAPPPVDRAKLRETAAELQMRARSMRGDLSVLKNDVSRMLADNFAWQTELIAKHVCRLRPSFPPQARRTVKSALGGLRQDVACLRKSVQDVFSMVTTSMADASRDLRRIAESHPPPSVVEARAIKELHGAIALLINEGNVAQELEHAHAASREERMRGERDRREAALEARDSPRLFGDRHVPATASASPRGRRDPSPPGVDDTAMPPPDDVMPALFGPRSWKYHVGSLEAAVPYAVKALDALSVAMRKNKQARDLLQLRITRQEREVAAKEARVASLEQVLRDHVRELQGVMARVAHGRVRQQMPAPDDSDVAEQLRGVSGMVAHMIDHLAYVAERHAAAAKRGTTVDHPPPTAGLVPTDPKSLLPPQSPAERARNALFPPSERNASAIAEAAILRHRLAKLRFRMLLEKWRFRRCAYALLQRHDVESAKEATEEQQAALEQALQASAEAGAASDVLAASRMERVLPFNDATRRLRESGVLPAPGADELLSAAEVQEDTDYFKFDRRVEQAQESWRARRAKAALAKFKQSSESTAQLESSKLLLELQGGHEAKPTVFSALQPSLGPRYQRATHVSASKQRLRPIGPVGVPELSSSGASHMPRCPRSRDAVPHAQPRPPATAPMPSRPAATSLGGVPVRDALNAFLQEQPAARPFNRRGLHLA